MKFGVGPCVAWGVQATYCGGGGGTFLYHRRVKLESNFGLMRVELDLFFVYIVNELGRWECAGTLSFEKCCNALVNVANGRLELEL